MNIFVKYLSIVGGINLKRGRIKVKDFIKALCLTLLFFAYSGLLFYGGMFVEKQIANEAEKQNEQIETQSDMNIAAHKTAEEYHKYYEIVVSRIRTTEFEGFNKKALDDYILSHDDRLNTLVEAFYPDKDDSTKYGTSFPMVYANFKKAFEEAELFTYKTLMLAMSTMDIEEEIERIFKDNQTYNVGNSADLQNTETAETQESLENTENTENNQNTETLDTPASETNNTPQATPAS